LHDASHPKDYWHPSPLRCMLVVAMSDVTQILQQIEDDDLSAGEQLLQLV
jgi:hypothetical protein